MASKKRPNPNNRAINISISAYRDQQTEICKAIEHAIDNPVKRQDLFDRILKNPEARAALIEKLENKKFIPEKYVEGVAIERITNQYQNHKKALHAKTGGTVPDNIDFYENCKYLRDAIVKGYLDDDTLSDYTNTVATFLRRHGRELVTEEAYEKSYNNKIEVLKGLFELFYDAQLNLKWEDLSLYGLKNALTTQFKNRMDKLEIVMEIVKKNNGKHIKKLKISGNPVFMELENRVNTFYTSHQIPTGTGVEALEVFPKWFKTLVYSKKISDDQDIKLPYFIPATSAEFEIWRSSLLLAQTVARNLRKESVVWDTIEKQLRTLKDKFNNIPEDKDPSSFQEEISTILTHLSTQDTPTDICNEQHADRLLKILLFQAEKQYNLSAKNASADSNDEKSLDSVLNTYIGLFYSLGCILEGLLPKGSEETSEETSRVEARTRSTYWNLLSKLFKCYARKIENRVARNKLPGQKITEDRKIEFVQKKKKEYIDKLAQFYNYNKIKFGESSLVFKLDDQECKWTTLADIAGAMTTLDWESNKRYDEKLTTIYNEVETNLQNSMASAFENALNETAKDFYREYTGEKVIKNTVIIGVMLRMPPLIKRWGIEEADNNWITQLKNLAKSEEEKDDATINKIKAFMGALAHKYERAAKFFEDANIKRDQSLLSLLIKWACTYYPDMDGRIVWRIGRAYVCHALATLAVSLDAKVGVMKSAFTILENDNTNKTFQQNDSTNTDSREATWISQWKNDQYKWEHELEKTHDYASTLEEAARLHHPKATAELIKLFEKEPMMYLIHEKGSTWNDKEGTMETHLQEMRETFKATCDKFENTNTPVSPLLRAHIDAYLNGADTWKVLDKDYKMEDITQNMTTESWVNEMSSNPNRNMYDDSTEKYNGIPGKFQASLKYDQGLKGAIRNIEKHFKDNNDKPYEFYPTKAGNGGFKTLTPYISSVILKFVKQSKKKCSDPANLHLKFSFIKQNLPQTPPCQQTTEQRVYSRLHLVMTNLTEECQTGDPLATYKKVKNNLSGDTGINTRDLVGLADYMVIHQNADKQICVCKYLADKPECRVFHEAHTPADPEDAENQESSVTQQTFNEWSEKTFGKSIEYNGYTEVLTFYY